MPWVLIVAAIALAAVAFAVRGHLRHASVVVVQSRIAPVQSTPSSATARCSSAATATAIPRHSAPPRHTGLTPWTDQAHASGATRDHGATLTCVAGSHAPSVDAPSSSSGTASPLSSADDLPVAQKTTTDESLSDSALSTLLAIEHGATLYSCDNDFSRFVGLRWVDPLCA